MRAVLRWIIIILTIAVAPRTLRHGWYLWLSGSERQASEWAVTVGFCCFLITLGLKLLSREPPDDTNPNQ